MSTLEIVCQAIKQKRLLTFHYEGQLRIVEPQILGRNGKGHMILSAWQVGGYSESGARFPWRDYRVVRLSKVTVQNESFGGPRPGYVKGGGKKFSRVFCELMEDVQAH